MSELPNFATALTIGSQNTAIFLWFDDLAQPADFSCKLFFTYFLTYCYLLLIALSRS